MEDSFGTPLPRPDVQTVTWDGTGNPPPGFGWTLSPETVCALEEIDANRRRAATMASHTFFD